MHKRDRELVTWKQFTGYNEVLRHTFQLDEHLMLDAKDGIRRVDGVATQLMTRMLRNNRKTIRLQTPWN